MLSNVVVRISIHSPSAGRDINNAYFLFRLDISIHSPSAGRDQVDGLRENRYSYFNPLSLCRERQKLRGLLFCRNQISIHSPSAGRDQVDGLRENRYSYFNPLSLCRERLKRDRPFQSVKYFNPLSLCRERQQFCT